MDILWNPWRFAYINSVSSNSKNAPEGCVFCDILNSPAADEEKFILHRAGHNFVILNAYPYVSGHLMVVPYEHLDALDKTEKNAADELMDLTKVCQTVLRETYKPDGMNLGMNFGRAAGAGVAGHIHMHILPRWIGDSNFMTPIGETRTIPESLEQTYQRLKGKF